MQELLPPLWLPLYLTVVRSSVLFDEDFLAGLMIPGYRHHPLVEWPFLVSPVLPSYGEDSHREVSSSTNSISPM